MKETLVDISVIIPTYNCAELLEKSMKSVFEQKNSSFECVIADGKSIDCTLETAKKYQGKYADQVTIISEKDQGIYDAMNKGVKAAKGRYVVFLGAGDTFCDAHIFEKIAGHREDIVYGYVNAYDSENAYIFKRKMNFFTAFKYSPICHQAIFAKRELLERYPFELRYRYVADQAWILRMYSLHKKFKYIDLKIANYGLDGFSSTEEGRKQAVEEILDAKKRYFPVRSFMIRSIKKIIP